MSRFPAPPGSEELARIRAEWRRLPAGTELWRVYFRGGSRPTFWNTARHFGPSASRFDHHLPPARHQERAILYAAVDGLTCLAEFYQATRVIERAARDPWLVAFQFEQPLELLDLTGSWPTRAGASMAINSGSRPRAQRWSRAAYDAYPAAQGLYYASSMHGNRPAVALYELGLGALPARPVFHRSLLDPCLLSVLRNAAWDLGYALL